MSVSKCDAFFCESEVGLGDCKPCDIPGSCTSCVDTDDIWVGKRYNQIDTGEMQCFGNCRTKCSIGDEYRETESGEWPEMCQSCQEGKYWTNYKCESCPAGKYSLVERKTSCTDCAVGKVSGAGANTCVDCIPGKYENSHTSCLQCPAGTYNPDAGKGWPCQNCTDGKWSFAGVSQCFECEAGKYSDLSITPKSACEDCIPGTYQDQTGQNHCKVCSNLCEGFLFNCKLSHPGTCKECSSAQYSVKISDTPRLCMNFAKLKRGGAVVVVDGEDKIIEYDADMRETITRVPANSYLTGTKEQFAKCDWCGSYAYAIGCGALQLNDVNDIAIKLGGQINLVSEWTTVIGKNQSDLVLDDFSKQQGMIIRKGKCFPCEQCTSGYYLRDCRNKDQRGNCFMCRRECESGKFLTHNDQRGCMNTYRETSDDIIAEYIAQIDYTCSDCLNAHYQHGAYELLVGCAGVGSFTRWHPRAETDADKNKLLAVTCEFDAATGLGAAGDEACYHGGRRLWKSVGAVYPAGQTLRDQNWTSTMPYCPPGWRVDADKFTVSSVWRPDACVRCTECGTRRRASHWCRCSGQFTQDTQNACADSCNVGEYMNAGVCKACQKC